MAKKKMDAEQEVSAETTELTQETTAGKVEKTAETEIEIVDLSATETTGTCDTSESNVPEFTPDPKEKRPKKFKGYKLLNEKYSDEQGLNILRKKIQGYKELHERFADKIMQDDAFLVERVYAAVYCAKSEVRYVWTTKGETAPVSHTEIRGEERYYTAACADLNVTEFSKEELTELDKAKTKKELLKVKKYSFKKVVKSFNKSVKQAAPDLKSKSDRRGEEYEVVYVPVMKVTCSFEGENYVGYVNLYNGGCYSDYKVSDRLEKAAVKAVSIVRSSKQSLVSTGVFALILTALASLNVLYPAWDFGSVTLGEAWVVIVLAVMAVVPFGLCFALTGYKKKTLIEKAVKSGKLPNAILAIGASILGWIACFGAAVLFFFQSMN